MNDKEFVQVLLEALDQEEREGYKHMKPSVVIQKRIELKRLLETYEND